MIQIIQSRIKFNQIFIVIFQQAGLGNTPWMIGIQVMAVALIVVVMHCDSTMGLLYLFKALLPRNIKLVLAPALFQLFSDDASHVAKCINLFGSEC